ncbi:MAG: sugar transferase [Candidatus Saganbacteria bacterium]|nr:sugar transferase [Candidatus Saganbacteria bacterium]
MNRRGFLFNLFVISCDVLIIIFSFSAGHYLKQGFHIPFEMLVIQNSRLLIFAVFTVLVFFNLLSVYSTSVKRSEFDEASAVAAGLTLSMVFFEFMTIFYRDLIFKRLIIFYAWLISMVLIGAVHVGIIIIQKKVFSRGIGILRIMIIGHEEERKLISQKIKDHPEMGLRAAHSMGPVEALSNAIDLRKIFRQNRINKVIFSVPDASNGQILALIEKCELEKVEFQFVPRVLDIIESRISSDEIIGIPLISVREIKLYGANAFIKRCSDIILSIVLGAVFFPAMFIIAVLIKLGSKGPVFYMQKRVGREGKEFKMFKFRSMVIGAEKELDKIAHRNEADGHIFKIKDDPRTTRIGKALRRSSLDELPQIINVIRGEMSFVGPRPPLPDEVQRYSSWHKKRLRIAPGLTGLWQVSGRSGLSFEDMVKLDIFYIENWSLWLDVKIIFKTVAVVMTSKGAY